MRLLKTLVCLILAAAVSTAGSQNGANGELTLEQVRRHLASGSFDQAALEASTLLKTEPQSAEAHALLAFAEWKLNRMDEAIRDYRTAIRLDPKSFSAHYNLALLYLQQGDAQAALPELERSAQLDPQNANVQYNCGLVLLDAQRASDALVRLQRVRQLEPERADAQFQTVRAYLLLNRLTNARQEAALFSTSHPDGTAAIGQAFLEFGHPEDAIPYLQKAIKANPADESTRHLLAEAWLFKGRLLQRANDARANDFLNRTIELEPNWFEPRYSLAVSFYLQYNYDAALRQLGQALRLDGRCARCLFLTGVIDFNRADLPQAKSAFDRAITLEPASARFRTHRGVLFSRWNKLPEAEADLRDAIALDPKYGLPHYELGKLLVRSSRLDDAARELETAVRLNPGLTQALYQLGQVDTRLGKQNEAAQAFQRFRQQKAAQSDEQVLRNDLMLDGSLKN